MDHGATRKKSHWRSGRSHRSSGSRRPRHAAGRGDGPDRALRAARGVWHGGPAARGGGRGGIWHRARPRPGDRGPALHGWTAAPDDVAGRLHVLARIVGELRGAYNDQGIRRWFERRRTTLNDRTPQELLAGARDPDADGPGAVLAIARSLNASAA